MPSIMSYLSEIQGLDNEMIKIFKQSLEAFFNVRPFELYHVINFDQ